MEHWFNPSQTKALSSIWPLQLSAQGLIDQRAQKDAIVALRGPRPVPRTCGIKCALAFLDVHDATQQALLGRQFRWPTGTNMLDSQAVLIEDNRS
jgi:hypothetical protein